jgi:hypothetical protein
MPGDQGDVAYPGAEIENALSGTDASPTKEAFRMNGQPRRLTNPRSCSASALPSAHSLVSLGCTMLVNRWWRPIPREGVVWSQQTTKDAIDRWGQLEPFHERF